MGPFANMDELLNKADSLSIYAKPKTITFTREELERLIGALEYAYTSLDEDMGAMEHVYEIRKLGELVERIKQEAE